MGIYRQDETKRCYFTDRCDRNLYLIWQFRYALGKKASVCMIAVEEDEPEQTAQRGKLKKRLASKHHKLDLGCLVIGCSLSSAVFWQNS